MCSLLSGQAPAVGAGIARDIETIASIGVRTCLAVSALTVQTHEHAWNPSYATPSGGGSNARYASA
ncbi:hydroxymethylpyrimidine/phosphomethylpyrimidine kinase [Mesorhizobium sp. M1060]